MDPFDRLLLDSKIKEYVTDKRLSAKSYVRYMFLRLMKMFKYQNLPDTLPQEMLEYYLLSNGTCFVTKVDDKIYAFVGGQGGEPDVYYRPTRYTFASPALNFSAFAEISDAAATEMNNRQWKVGEDGILVRNDSMWVGMYPLVARYAAMMAENILTVRTADIMLRITAWISAPDDKTRISAETYIRKLEKGELSVIGESPFFSGIKLQAPPSNNGSYLTQFIELQQYLKGSFYNEIGLNANFNMKREAIGEGESSLNEDSLLPLCEDMLKCRKEDMEKISDLFQLDPPITVEFDSAWAKNIRQMDAELEKLENEAEEDSGEGEESVSQLTGEEDSDGNDGIDSEEDSRDDSAE
jgi:hypothetical protein